MIAGILGDCIGRCIVLIGAAALFGLMTCLAKKSSGTATVGLSAFNLGGNKGVVAWFIIRTGPQPPLLVLIAGSAIIAASGAVWVVESTDASHDVLAFRLLGFAINGVKTTSHAVAANLYPDAIQTTGL